MPKTTYFVSETGKKIRVETLDAETEIVTTMPDTFVLPEPPSETVPEPPPVPKKSDLKNDSERALYGRQFGFDTRKQKDIPSLLELKD